MKSRLLLLAAILGAEAIAASVTWDGDTLPPALAALRLAGPWLLRWSIGALALFVTFAHLRRNLDFPVAKPNGKWLIAHLLSAVTFTAISAQLYKPSAPPGLLPAWAIAAAATALTATFALIPVKTLLQRTGHLWWQAAASSALACWLGEQSRQLWDPATRSTFTLVQLLLQPLLPNLVSRPEQLRIGTPRFTVIISPECSGLEGIGLLLIFGVFWLILFRHELRFPRALTLLPIALVSLYLLNAVRIAALVVIGAAGYRQIAAGGFHSQAGWIAFNVVALGLSLAARRWQWIARSPVREAENPAAPFLLPFLGITAAGILSNAVSAGFEWAYGLRVLAAAAILWHYRQAYKPLSLRPTVLAPVAGLAVFVLWLAADHLLGPGTTTLPTPHPAWLAVRTAGAVVTVPIAEELAFRGFGYRRPIREEFETVPWNQLNWPALAISSLLFGVLHGKMWLPGTLAGLLYGAAMLRGGKLADAVVAHSITNACLAAYVIFAGRWDLW